MSGMSEKGCTPELPVSGGVHFTRVSGRGVVFLQNHQSVKRTIRKYKHVVVSRNPKNTTTRTTKSVQFHTNSKTNILPLSRTNPTTTKRKNMFRI